MYPVILIDDLYHFVLVGLFDLGKLGENVLVVGEIAELDKLGSAAEESVADGVLKKLGKSRIRLIQPASVSDTICNILELLRSILVFIVEYRFLDNLRMEL